jgi:hypothetical protein
VQYFHVAFAVLDLEEAMGELSARLGVAWRSVTDGSFPMRGASGAVRELPMRFVYSAGGPPAIELFEAVPDSPFAATPSGFHHLGYWVEDLPAASGDLERGGWPCLATLAEGPDPSRFAVHRSPLGFCVELLDQGFDRPWMRDLFPPASHPRGV